MDNVLKKTIREEIEKYNKEKGEGSKSDSTLPVNTSPATPKEKKKSILRLREDYLTFWKRSEVRVASEAVRNLLLKR